MCCPGSQENLLSPHAAKWNLIIYQSIKNEHNDFREIITARTCIHWQITKIQVIKKSYYVLYINDIISGGNQGQIIHEAT